MRVIELSDMDGEVRDQLLTAVTEPVLITEKDHPLLVVRSLLDDDMADDLIVQHPEFRESIRRAREQKASGQTKQLAELRAKYATQDVEAS